MICVSSVGCQKNGRWWLLLLRHLCWSCNNAAHIYPLLSFELSVVGISKKMQPSCRILKKGLALWFAFFQNRQTGNRNIAFWSRSLSGNRTLPFGLYFSSSNWNIIHRECLPVCCTIASQKKFDEYFRLQWLRLFWFCFTVDLHKKQEIQDNQHPENSLKHSAQLH